MPTIKKKKKEDVILNYRSENSFWFVSPVCLGVYRWQIFEANVSK